MKNPWLFIHGGWGGSWQWTPIINKLKTENIKTVAPDMPGMGESDGSHVSLTDFIDYTSSIIKKNPGPINIATFSFGGMTATALAERFSDKINKLIFIDAFVPDPGQSFVSIAGDKITRQIKAYTDVLGENKMIPPFFETDPRYRSHPLNTLFSDVHYKADTLDMLKPVYIECTAKDPEWTFTPLLEKTAVKIRERKWEYRELDSDHMPMYSHSDQLYNILME